MEFFAILCLISLFITNFFRSKTCFLMTYLTLVLFYDFIFINISLKYPDQNWVYYLKSWQEYLFIFLILRYLLLIRKPIIGEDKKLLFSFLTLFLISMISILIPIYLSKDIIKILLGYRSYLFPLFIPYLCYLNNLFYGVSLKQVINYFVVYIGLCLFFACYQRYLFIVFGGDRLIVDFSDQSIYDQIDYIFDRTFWYSNFFEIEQMGQWYDRVRDFKLRATSFYVSPLILALLMNLSIVLLSISAMFYKKLSWKILCYIGIIMALCVIYTAQVRSSFIFIFISTLVIMFMLFKNKSYKYLLLIPIILIVITFLKLIFLGGDHSEITRLNQFKILGSEFSFLGKGLGSVEADVKYDSMIISSLFAFGIFAFYFFYFHYRIVNIAFDRFKRMHKSNSYFPLGIFVISSFLGFIYFSFFQYTIGSPALKLFYFFIFYFLNNSDES